MAFITAQQREQGEAFALAAEAFCQFVDGPPAPDLVTRLQAAQTHLLELYRLGLALPAAAEVLDEQSVEPAPTARPAFVGFGAADIYWTVFDSTRESEPCAGSLSDDVLDVYRDLQVGLIQWRRAEPDHAGGLWSWRFAFDAHWGKHAIGALRALHDAIARYR